MGNVKEEGINMYLTDNYTPKMNQIISVTDNFRRATVAVSLSTNVMANSINNSIGSASSRVNSLNSSLRKVQVAASSVSSTITKLSSSINAVSGAIGSLNGSIMRLAVTIAMIINYFSKLIQKKNELNSNLIIILIFKAKSDEIEKTNSKISLLKSIASNIRLKIESFSAKKAIDKVLGGLKKLSGRIWEVVIKTKDTAKKVVSSLLEKLKHLTKNRWQSIVNIKDMASSVIGRILPKLMLFKGSFWNGVIAIKDMASSIISRVFPKLKLFAGTVWKGAIAVKDMASGILGSIKGKISDLTNGATIGVAMKKGVDLVGQEQNQKVLLENIMQRNTGRAGVSYVDKYYSDLENFSLSTPFDPKEVISMGTKAMMLSNGNRDKADDITKAMVGVRAFNMDTTSDQDVSAAFVSASRGNMEAINTLVGENYKTFDEAIKGITEKQGALAGKMAKTIPGLIASAQTSIDLGLKHMMEPFDGVLKLSLNKIDTFIKKAFKNLSDFSQKIANVMNGEIIIGNKYDQMQFRSMKSGKEFSDSSQYRISNVVEKRKMMSENKQENFENHAATMIGNAPKAIVNTGSMLMQNIDFTALIDSLFPVVNLVNNLLDNINNKSPVAQGLISIFGTIVTTAFQLIGPVVEAVSPIITRIFSFLGEYAPQINNFIETLGVIWETVWATIGPILEDAWIIVEPVLGGLFNLFNDICNIIKDVCKWWQNLVEKINKNPIIDTVRSIIDDWNSGTSKSGGNAFGLNYVPYNDYSTRLHEGEMVLTKQEANQYRSGKSGGNISIAKLADTIVIREEADIEKVTSKLVSSIKIAQLGGVL
ncbi:MULTISPECIES: hypothetical protein [Clostridioides]|uniref:hypothetical protein n=1 Tax=Clostridioides sp. ZZV14-6387 TaxID=2811497 RepID=UPI0007BBBCDC|nr:hypothetical protein [Clostridioides sp. ZZV14-6387]CZR96696.1 hypothetical protein CDFC105_61488 [Clostridioides difficile]CZS05270.1 hypothetical protein CDFC105_71789 [Clostridioides difficile]